MKITNGRWGRGQYARRTQLLVEVELGLDPQPGALEKADALALERGELQAYELAVKVINLETGRMGLETLGGILCESDADEHLDRVTDELLQAATDTALAVPR